MGKFTNSKIIEKISLQNRRRQLISPLKGRILEIGFGSGANFEFYSPEAWITGVEPSSYKFTRAVSKKNTLRNAHHFSLYNIGCGSDEMEQTMQNGYFDVVVCTLVLCTLPNPNTEISNFHRWLKPTGRLIVLEHIKSHRQLGGWIQNFFNPLWKKISNGCNLNRATDLRLMASDFQLITEKYFNHGLPFYQAVFEKKEKQI